MTPYFSDLTQASIYITERSLGLAAAENQELIASAFYYFRRSRL
jgi:hypothetical protein